MRVAWTAAAFVPRGVPRRLGDQRAPCRVWVCAGVSAFCVWEWSGQSAKAQHRGVCVRACAQSGRTTQRRHGGRESGGTIGTVA